MDLLFPHSLPLRGRMSSTLSLRARLFASLQNGNGVPGAVRRTDEGHLSDAAAQAFARDRRGYHLTRHVEWCQKCRDLVASFTPPT